jgi:hypothetical protein
VARTNDYGLHTLVNGRDTNISSVASNMRGADILKLCKSGNVVEQTFWNKLKDHVPRGPLWDSLNLWHVAIEEFVDAYLANFTMDKPTKTWLERDCWDQNLKDIIVSLYFMNILHELYSNEDLVHDMIQGNLSFICMKDHDAPPFLLHARSISVMVSTNGSTPKYTSSFSHLSNDTVQKNAFDAFAQKVKSLSQPLAFLGPENIEIASSY